MIEKPDLMRMEQARTDVFRLYENEEVRQLLEKAGFVGCRTEIRDEQFRKGVCVVGRKSWETIHHAAAVLAAEGRRIG